MGPARMSTRYGAYMSWITKYSLDNTNQTVMDFSRSVFLAVLVLCLVGAGCVSPNSSEISTSTESLGEDTTTDEQTPQLVANNSAKNEHYPLRRIIFLISYKMLLVQVVHLEGKLERNMLK